MHGSETQQLLTHVQVRNLAITAGVSAAIDITGFNEVVFLSNFVGATKLELEVSADGTTAWTAFKPNYYTSEAQKYPAEGDAVNFKYDATTTALKPFGAISIYGQGRESGIGKGIPKFFRVKATGATSVIALMSQASWKPAAQPEFVAAETKGAI